MTRRVALYGGSFNPPHLGHAQVVLFLLHKGFDEVWLIPAAAHPFGKELAPFAHRFSMLQLAMADFGPCVQVNDVESRLPAPSWTIDTVEFLVRRHPECSFELVLGEDQKSALNSWRRIDDLRRLTSFMFVRRGVWRHGDMEAAVPDYSSSEIRRRLAQGVMPDGWMHVRVCEYIRREGLYGYAPPSGAVLDVAIVGLGRVGGSLLSALQAAGNPPVWCADPDESRHESARRAGVPAFRDWMDAWRAAPVACIIFCTPDNWRPQVPDGFWQGRAPLCLHTGGMQIPQEVFAGLGLPENRLGILHPVMAVPNERTPLAGRLFSVTGDVDSPGFAGLLRLLSADTLPVAAPDRPLFHAACALLSNGSQVLLRETAALFEQIRLPEDLAVRLQEQLAAGALDAWTAHREAGITGPWIRRDRVAVLLHEQAIENRRPEILALYRALRERIFPVGASGMSGKTHAAEEP